MVTIPQNKTQNHHILLLGATGFIGQHILRVLLEEKETITCLIHRRPLPAFASGVIQEIHGSLFALNTNTLRQLGVDIIIHTARTAGKYDVTRYLAAQWNALQNRWLLEQIRQSGIQPRLLFVSGTLVYGHNGEEPVTEHAPLAPTSFARFYFSGEKPIVNALTQKTTPIIIVRPAWVYGAGSWFQKFFLHPIQLNRYVPLYGEGKNWMSLIHVEDCARMIVYFGRFGKPYTTYNISCGESIRQEDFANLLSEISGLPVKRFSIAATQKMYGRTVTEALTCSQKVHSIHSTSLSDFQFRYPNLREGLEQVLTTYYQTVDLREAHSTFLKN